MTAAVNSRDLVVWQLFVDWCGALGHVALPADSMVLAGFIAANPAAGATQRRRVGAINAMHRRAGYRPPGHAETIRELLDERRATRMRLRVATAADAIERLPAAGWPTALFARRDAVLLALAVAMPSKHISALRVGDVRSSAHDDCVQAIVGGEVFTTPTELAARGVSAAGILRDWLRVRSIQHHLPSTRCLAAFLRGDPVPVVAVAPDELPLVTAIDKWGAAPLLPTPLSAASISRIVTAHLTGSAQPHRPIAEARQPEVAETVLDAPEPHIPSLDPASLSRGVVARHRAARELDGVVDALDDVEERADQLLADLMVLLDGPAVSNSSRT